MKTAIVCEGGAMRGVYTAGVLQAFMEGGFVADELIGVSAGASNGVSYVSGQKGRGYRTNVDYAGDKRYLSLGNLLRTGSLFGMDFLFDALPNHLDPFDHEAFQASPCDFFAGATDIHTGRITWFGKDAFDRRLTPLRASCSMPMLARIVPVGGGEYLDGGIAAPIPLQKALDDGCERIVVVLTQKRGYLKQPQSFRLLYHAQYRHYPELVKCLDRRHLVYNHTLEQLWRLEAEGRAVVVAPADTLAVGRFGQDPEEMKTAYHLGCADGKAALARL